MKIYLDNCCFNRPFDDQSHIRIRLEAEAKLKIQDDIQTGNIELVWSYILSAENEANPFEERKVAIAVWQKLAKIDVGERSDILTKAHEIGKFGIHSKDALHIACAICSECTYFLTTDDHILNKNDLILEIVIIDPIGFIKEVYVC